MKKKTSFHGVPLRGPNRVFYNRNEDEEMCNIRKPNKIKISIKIWDRIQLFDR